MLIALNHLLPSIETHIAIVLSPKELRFWEASIKEAGRTSSPTDFSLKKQTTHDKNKQKSPKRLCIAAAGQA